MSDFHAGSTPSDNSNNTDIDHDPVHTVFFYNLPYSLDNDKFKIFVEKFGEVASLFDRHEKGFYFVTYYDVRHSKKAIEEAPGTELHGRPLKAGYAYKTDHPRKEKISSTILVKFADGSSMESVTDQDLQEAFSPFGEVRAIRREDPSLLSIKVKFYDFRIPDKVIENRQSIMIQNHPINVEIILGEDDALDLDLLPKKAGFNRFDDRRGHG